MNKNDLRPIKQDLEILKNQLDSEEMKTGFEAILKRLDKLETLISGAKNETASDS